MGADQKNLWTGAGNLDLDVVAGLPAQVITLSPRMKSGARKGSFNEIGSGIELRTAPHVSLAEFSGEFLDIGAKPFAQCNFIGRKRRSLRNILVGHSHSKPPEEQQNGGDDDGHAQS